MHIFHKWSRWEEVPLVRYSRLGDRKERREGQKRTCLKCNFIEVRLLST